MSEFKKGDYIVIIDKPLNSKDGFGDEIPNPKEIIDDWDYCDWKYRCEGTDYEQKALRK